jgi:hypothetical protein
MLPAAACLRTAVLIVVLLTLHGIEAVQAAGVPAGTVIENTATVTYELSGATVTVDTNPTSITVAERIDVIVTRQSPQVLVQPGETDRAILFRVTNTGNGDEAFALAIDSNIPGSDFNPVPASRKAAVTAFSPAFTSVAMAATRSGVMSSFSFMLRAGPQSRRAAHGRG